MVNLLTFNTRLSDPADPKSSGTSDLRLYLGARTYGTSSSLTAHETSTDEQMMEIDDTPISSSAGTTASSSSLEDARRRQNYYLMETDTDEYDEAVPASDEIYHAVVRLVDASEAVNGHFVQIDAPSIIDIDEDEDDEMIGDVLLSSSSDSDTDSTASWKSVASGNSEDNENRSHGSSTPTPLSPWLAATPSHTTTPASTTTSSATVTPSTPRRHFVLLPPPGPSPSSTSTTRNRSSGVSGMVAFDGHPRRNGGTSTSLRPLLSENVNPSSSSSLTTTNIPRSQRRGNSTKSSSSRCESSANPSHHPYYTLDGGNLRPYKFDTILSNPPLDQETLEKHSWNPEDRSLNIFVKDDDRLTFHRHPVAQSTDCIRGKIGYSKGFHVWKITWPQRMRGTHAVIGLATKAAPLHQVGYVSLIGQNPESYGWDIIRNKCYNDGKITNGWNFPSSSTIGETSFTVPDSFYCILDMDDGYMAFATDTKFLGVAFCDLKGKKLYPIVSAVWGHCEVTMNYLGGLDSEPRALMDVCRRTIRMQMNKSITNLKIQQLPIPPILQKFVMYKE
jgi:SPRY domain-containing SOCS box protein 1/4